MVGPITVSAGGSSDAISGLDHDEFMLNGGNTQTGPSASVSAHGTTIVRFWAVDALGDALAWVSRSVCIT